MDKWHNRKKAAETCRATNARKRFEKYKAANPFCRICMSEISFDDFCSGRKNLCRSKACRSEVNRQNSLKQDKTKIAEQIVNSPKWIAHQRESLLQKRSKIELCYEKVFKSFFADIQTQVHLKLPNSKSRFADFVVNGVVVEIDGPYHQEERDRLHKEYCVRENLHVIRIDITRHWSELFSEIGDVVNEIRAYSSAERAPALQVGGRRFDPD